MRTTKEIADEAREALARNPETPEQHFQRMIDAGFINAKGQVTTLLGGKADPEPGTPIPKYQPPWIRDQSPISPPPSQPVWHPASQELPELEVQDRVLVVVREFPFLGAKYKVARVVILIATETGWDSPDAVYGGYTPQDGIAWMLEKELLGCLPK